MLSTVYSVEVTPFVPRNLPMIVGYTQELDIERGARSVAAYTPWCALWIPRRTHPLPIAVRRVSDLGCATTIWPRWS